MKTLKETVEETIEGKANNLIPLWAEKPNQINYKIIRAYFKALKETPNHVTISQMEELCSNKDDTSMYVEKFMLNYRNMKTDIGHSRGHVFEDNGSDVWIWDEVKDTLEKYRPYFEK